MRQLWVDFNEIDKQGHVTSLAEFAEDGVTLALGQTLVVGDDDGTVCSAVITDLGTDGTVSLALDMGTFHHDGSRAAIAV